MPTLPTIDVTAEQATRILATYGTAARYRNWLRRSIVSEVSRNEATQLTTDLGLTPEPEA